MHSSARGRGCNSPGLLTMLQERVVRSFSVRPRRIRTARFAAVALIGIATTQSVCAEQPAGFLRVISSRSDSISGDDVLVDLTDPAGLPWTVRLNGRSVSSAFHRGEQTGHLLALLNGLKLGKNELEVRINGAVRSRLELIDHALAGPIFSGAHQEPFICQTLENGLGPSLDADCSARTKVQYYYKSTTAVDTDLTPRRVQTTDLAPGFKAYDPSAMPPIDVAQTVTSDGRSVPYIVRREIGTLNRAVYDIQFLHQPNTPLPTPWTRPTPGWNGRLLYLVDGGCSAGYRQGTIAGAIGAANEPFVSRGYATATATLNVGGNNCNDRISAETLSMVKENFIKQYGVPVHTIGWGDSGGAINLQLAAQNYPSLLDGLIPYFSFPDETSIFQSVIDCALLDRAFDNSTNDWTEAQKTAVSGFASWRTCADAWGDGKGHPWPVMDPRKLCTPLLSKDAIYNRESNPHGVRCDLYDNEINVFGRNPRTGWAYRPLDNVGVQYGLRAFNRGQIDAEQFIELNEQVGGVDTDGVVIAARTQAEPEAIRNAYDRGLLLTGGGGLSEVPIIEWRVYEDDMANNHDRFRSFVTRARLIAANGSAGNQVLLVYPRYSLLDLARFMDTRRFEAVFAERASELVRQMDHWLDAIAEDGAEGTLSTKVVRDRPADLADGCWGTDGERIVEPATYNGASRCNQLYPPHADPRIAAGGPLTDDILKCALKSVRAEDYSRPVTPEQLARLKVIFPTGVCDYTRQGVGQEITTATWQKF